MTNKIDPTTFKPGDIVHVRGRVVSCEYGNQIINVDFDGERPPIGLYEIVAHFPAIRSWSEIEGRLTDLIIEWECEEGSLTKRIIALLNEVDPKGDV
jgi:hypothetical protein